MATSQREEAADKKSGTAQESISNESKPEELSVAADALDAEKAETEENAKAEAEAESEISSEPKAEVKVEAEEEVEETEAEPEAKVNDKPETEVIVEVEEETEEEAESEVEPEAEVNGELEAEVKVEAEEEAEAESKEEVEAKAEAEAKAKSEAEAKAKAEAEAKAEVEAEEKAKIEAEAKSKVEAEEKAKAETKAETGPEAEAEAKPESEAEAETEVNDEPKSEVKAEIEDKPENEVKAEATEEKDKAEAEVAVEAKAEEKAETEETITVTDLDEEPPRGTVSETIKKMTQSPAILPGESSKATKANICVSSEIRATDIMQKEVVWATSEERVQEALAKMQQRESGYIMIGKDGILEGIVSKSDITGATSVYLRPIFAKWHGPGDDATLQIKLKWIMSSPVRTVRSETPLATIIDNMCRFGGRGLPVVDEQGKVQGLVTVFDIFRALSDTSEDISVVGKTAEVPAVV